VVEKVIVAKAIGINMLYIRIFRFVINGKKRVKKKRNH
jgi:3-methyladenine DNA glycosylase Mpg